MAHALWKGTISFGLVNIPINLHTAVRDSRLRFRMLHAKDKSPIKFDRVCQREGKPVAWDHLVRGFEYEKGKFVVLTKEDFETAALEKSQTVDILNFVNAEEVDDRFFETPYYLTPGKGGDRAYALLREAIRASGRIGVAKIIFRETQHLAALMAIKNALVLTMLRFADELVDLEKFSFPGAKDVRPKELEMAKSLVENLSDTWSPEKYTDEYRANLMRVIKAKLQGKKPKLEEEELKPEQTEVIDLMARLRQSLASGEKPRRGERTHAVKKGKVARRVA
jgi:DNA end-binding protein Ku